MSVINTRNIQIYGAPVSLGPEHISITGSWTCIGKKSSHTMHMSFKNICHYRVANWKQQIKNDIVPACLDIVVQDIENRKITIEFKLATSKDCFYIIEQVHTNIDKILNTNQYVKKIIKLFQHTQPGEFLGGDDTGRAGNDGANHSV
jgi:hypothetical protein